MSNAKQCDVCNQFYTRSKSPHYAISINGRTNTTDICSPTCLVEYAGTQKRKALAATDLLGAEAA